MELLSKDLVGDERIAAHEFFLTLAACNTVIPIPTPSRSSGCTNGLLENVEAIDYQGESPDEQALVSAASAYGYTLFERTSGHIVIDINGEGLRYTVSHFLCSLFLCMTFISHLFIPNYLLKLGI